MVLTSWMSTGIAKPPCGPLAASLSPHAVNDRATVIKPAVARQSGFCFSSIMKLRIKMNYGILQNDIIIYIQ